MVHMFLGHPVCVLLVDGTDVQSIPSFHRFFSLVISSLHNSRYVRKISLNYNNIFSRCRDAGNRSRDITDKYNIHTIITG